MKQWHSQRGMSAIGWLLTVAVLGFFVLVGIRLTPTYLEYYKVASVLDSLKKPGADRPKSGPEIRKMISRRFDINDVHSLQSRDVKVRREGAGYEVSAEYEVREHLIGNVDVVIMFSKQVLVTVY